jgi:hypothetical protein
LSKEFIHLLASARPMVAPSVEAQEACHT